MDCVVCQGSLSMGFHRQESGVGCHFRDSIQVQSCIAGRFYTAKQLSDANFFSDLALSLLDFSRSKKSVDLGSQCLCVSDQIRSVTQSYPTLCDPMNRSTPGLPVHHQLPEFIQTHVHQVSDAIQPSHPLSSPSPLAPNRSQHQSFFQ